MLRLSLFFSVTEVNIHRDKKKAAEFETIDYMPQDSEMYRKWLHTQPLQRVWDRWLMMFVVGIVVGLCAFSLHVCFNSLATWKVCARKRRGGRPRRGRCALLGQLRSGQDGLSRHSGEPTRPLCP